tara:strand:+ start:276 stop:494 length:219 start_codon:yes stop_codon:yes gene_type:complete
MNDDNKIYLELIIEALYKIKKEEKEELLNKIKSSISEALSDKSAIKMKVHVETIDENDILISLSPPNDEDYH